AVQSADPAVERVLGCKPAECRATAELASPVTHLDKDDPPGLLIHGDLDKGGPGAPAQKVREALLAEDRPNKFVQIEGVGHSFVGADATSTRRASLRALEATFEFIDATTKR